jgi:hypothetical protein
VGKSVSISAVNISRYSRRHLPPRLRGHPLKNQKKTAPALLGKHIVDKIIALTLTVVERLRPAVVPRKAGCFWRGG